MASDFQANLNNFYRTSRGEESGEDDRVLINAFDNLASRIIADLHPASALDAACGKGYLVKALRLRGVDAWGLDGSEDLIRNASSEVQAYLQVGSALSPIPHRLYDLVICIDCLEHLPPEQASKAVENLCKHTGDILLSCLPFELGDDTVLNAQSPGYWVALFSPHGFIHDISYDASFLAPWAMRLRKAKLSADDLLINYERKLWLLAQENELRRQQGIEQLRELSARESQHQNQVNIINYRAQADIQYWKTANDHSQAELQNVLNSTSWRFMTRIQGIRLKLIPLGSRREAAMRTVFSGFKALRREGPFGFIALSFQKLKRSIELNVIKSRNKLALRNAESQAGVQACEIGELPNRPGLTPHTEAVDIIICVHNALEDVQRCLASLLEHTTQPYNLILVDDGSGEPTAKYLREFSVSHAGRLLRADTATGYPAAANRGMRASTAEYVVLLNSDTILTPEWLDRFCACMRSDPKLGIVGPLSNTASWQSVPKIEQDGDWASNPLPDGLSPAMMARLIAANSARLYLDMPLLNGFCMLFRHKLLDEVGLFDEEAFGQGYGEEDDLVLRARKQGWKMALADDVYIYHAQSKSYSSEKRHALSEHAGKTLREKHGEAIISEGVHFCQADPVLEGIRARAQIAYERHQCLQAREQFAGKRILFVLPINTPGGGANVIRSESVAVQKMGVKVDYFNLAAHRAGFTTAYPDLAATTIFGKPEDLESLARGYDAVIATYNPTVAWLSPLASRSTRPSLGYYVQGFEPWMYAPGTQGYKTALDSYTLIDDLKLFTKTEWTRGQVMKETGRDSAVIGASVDIDLYCPRPRDPRPWPESPLRIAAMIRPESPYREPLKTMQLLRNTALKYKGEVEIVLFGTPFENPAFRELPSDFPSKLYGILTTGQVANLLSQVDIFLDYSSQQAMGLTAMEAMACGSAVIVPQYGGASSYAKDGQNSLVVDMSSFDNVWVAMQRLIDDENLRLRLQRKAVYDICSFYPEKAALNMLKVLFER